MAAYVSLADFAQGFTEIRSERPEWLPADAARPLTLDHAMARARLEDILDTVVALQRAEWLEDGVYLGPHVMPGVYAEVLDAARTLSVAVPPVLVAGISMSSQGIHGTDARHLLRLSTAFVGSAPPEETRFLVGRLLGLSAARLVSAQTLYALLADHSGLREVARRALGPVLEVVLAPLSIGVRLAASRWHRYAAIGADRAGLLCAGSLAAARRAMLRQHLGGDPAIEPEAWMAQLDAIRSQDSPARFAQLLADEPWTHTRLRALALFARSECYVRCGGEPEGDGPLLDDAALDQQVRHRMGIR